jgi:hypothetical protein
LFDAEVNKSGGAGDGYSVTFSYDLMDQNASKSKECELYLSLRWCSLKTESLKIKITMFFSVIYLHCIMNGLGNAPDEIIRFENA